MTDNENDSSSENDSRFENLDKGVALAVGFGLLLVVAALAIVLGTTLGVFGGETSSFEYPEGASESGFENVSTVVSGHDSKLQETSFTITVENKANGEQTAALTYAYDNEKAMSLRTEDLTTNQNEIVEDYANQEIVVAQNLSSNNVTYQREFLRQTSPYTAGFELQNFIQAANYTATDVVEQEDGTKVVVYEVDGLTEQTQQQVDELTGEIRLSEEGYFTLVDLNVTTTVQGQEITENQRVVFSDIGSTTVEEPDWLEAARQSTDEPQPPQPPTQGGEDDGSTDDGSTDDGSTDDGSTDDGSTDDGSTDDGTSDGSTDGE